MDGLNLDVLNIKIIVGIILIVLGLVYIIAPKRVFEMKTGEKEADPKNIKATRIGGLVTFCIGAGFFIYGILTA